MLNNSLKHTISCMTSKLDYFHNRQRRRNVTYNPVLRNTKEYIKLRTPHVEPASYSSTERHWYFLIQLLLFFMNVFFFFLEFPFRFCISYGLLNFCMFLFTFKEHDVYNIIYVMTALCFSLLCGIIQFHHHFFFFIFFKKKNAVVRQRCRYSKRMGGMEKGNEKNEEEER